MALALNVRGIFCIMIDTNRKGKQRTEKEPDVMARPIASKNNEDLRTTDCLLLGGM